MTRSLSLSGLLVLLTLAFSGCTQPAPVPEKDSATATAPASTPSTEEAADPAPPPQATPAISDTELTARLDLPDVVERVMPSVVGISTERTLRQRQRQDPFFDDPFFRQFSPFFGQPQAPRQPRERTQQGIGSGVIVDAAGVIVTNHHVIDGADTILITLSDGRELTAEVTGQDPQSDIAVLRVQDPPGDLEPIAFGDSDALRLGESVIAIGNPFGLSGTVTLGIISAKGRGNVGIVDYEDFLQTDAAINPGNSGGALLNLRGELIGINTAIVTRSGGYQGVGFAIPSNMVDRVITSLLEDGEVHRGWLGVALQPLTSELAEALGVDPSLRGVVLSDVHPDSPADAAGLQRGDVIVSLDGSAVRSPNQLRNYVGLRSPGDSIAVEVVRNGDRRTLDVALAARHDQAALAPDQDASDDVGLDGLSLSSLDPQLRREHRLPDSLTTGVVVTAVEPGSDAARFQLRPGDVILEVNRRSISTPAQFAEAFQSGQRNLLLLYRDGSTIFMTR